MSPATSTMCRSPTSRIRARCSRRRLREYHARFSHDGRWVSYVSNESGRDEVYVMRFRARPASHRLAVAGGRVRDLHERRRPSALARGAAPSCIYVSPDQQVMAATIDIRGDSAGGAAGDALFAINPKPVGWVYDVSADGQRFIVNSLGDEGTTAAGARDRLARRAPLSPTRTGR